MSSPAVHTSSPKQRPDRPIASVKLKVFLHVTQGSASRVKELFSSARLEGNRCEVEIAGDSPAAVADKVRDLLERARKVTG